MRLIGGVVDFNIKYGKGTGSEMQRCKICGEPTGGETCAVCKLKMRLATRLNTTPP